MFGSILADQGPRQLQQERSKGRKVSDDRMERAVVGGRCGEEWMKDG